MFGSLSPTRPRSPRCGQDLSPNRRSRPAAIHRAHPNPQGGKRKHRGRNKKRPGGADRAKEERTRRTQKGGANRSPATPTRPVFVRALVEEPAVEIVVAEDAVFEEQELALDGQAADPHGVVA